MPANNSRVWSSQELSTFLSIIGDSVIQRELDGSVRNEKVYKDISQRMAAEEFERTSGQCRAKLKKLKGQYKKFKDDNNRSGNSRRTWKWYDAMDAIYGHRPANQGREGRSGLCNFNARIHDRPLLKQVMESPMMHQMFPTMDLQPLSAAPVLFPQANHRVANHRVRPMHPGTLVKEDGCRWICAQSWRICGHQRKGSWKGLRTFLRGDFRHCVRMHRKLCARR
ncbi:hypothetical protein AB205_0089210, partial [Aquarana catesbeiana]